MHLIRCQEKLSQSQALNALVFLYKHVLKEELEKLLREGVRVVLE